MELDSMTKGKLSNKEMPDIRTIYKAFDFATSFALKSTMTMGIPDILARSKEPMTADNIVEKLPCKNPAAAAGYLDRIMDILIVPGFYSKTPVSNADGKSHKAAYGLTPVSRMLVKDDVQFTLLPIALLHVHRVFTDSFQHLHKSVLEDRAPMEVALGKPFYEYLAENQDVRSTFQEALSCHSNYWIKIIAQEYDGLEHTKTLVDVGGCEGESLKELVAVHPHIHGINFDMPVVIQNAPQIPGVDHVGGDYFASVPAGDTIFLKMVLHNNGDEECLKILKNCYQALPERGGKVIIVESVYDHDSKEDEAQFVKYLDVMMLSVFLNGRERSFDAYKALLTSCGFGDCKLIKLSGGVTLIEAYKY
ncbi:protein MpOMT19 [Marchantia polymorpha subsp. ruderalis]|uniref:O-methyltransferase domain-containing protein n=2 Tax=Marchantia polymorpha TaxID=3197 RepID=A0AAF6BFQ5_MARPO|nr:hypothetical protein MARPO_0136s0036 [Marchantia polymorpha]BBN10839.1 hypothetical protein Mp_5g06850 [Marchantia polymorpha subsp. ruderalis]|eukprot:PTQ29711.1 hypothetical protein MARPO_0136s0036 [Marchantia polymorpha]